MLTYILILFLSLAGLMVLKRVEKLEDDIRELKAKYNIYDK
jgi:hypothetical protein